MAFSDSFCIAYAFRLLYQSSALMYPIMGALRKTYASSWEVYKRYDLSKRQEEYVLVGEFDHEPRGEELTSLFRPKPAPYKFGPRRQQS